MVEAAKMTGLAISGEGRRQSIHPEQIGLSGAIRHRTESSKRL